ncbi:uracil phosphoribosyltransferase-domain-containing protein [Hypoxylon sp. FL0890]|nr:uracil phosphoribosyltransferase-domain-containing protein [Hypoxylon sp. FL0890]
MLSVTIWGKELSKMNNDATASSTETQSMLSPTPPSAVGASTSSKKKPVVIGIYGLPGSGKSFLLDELKYSYRHEQYGFYEGSELIGKLIPGGLEAFQKLDKKEHQDYWRKLAIEKIGQEVAETGRTTIISGHLMFWQEGEKEGVAVYTQNDLHVYTHILYLDVPAELIATRRREDVKRSRPVVSISHLRKWQDTEKCILRQLCYSHGILFLPVSPGSSTTRRVSRLIHNFQEHTEEENLRRAELQLDEIILNKYTQPNTKTIVVIDGDRTLAAEDTGALFWSFHRKLQETKSEATEQDPLKVLFSSPLGYSYTAFLQASLLYEEASVQEKFEDLCAQTALATTLYPEVVDFIRLAQSAYVDVIVMTCGPQRIWEKILGAKGLKDGMNVLGGGCITNGLIVTPTVKASLVARLRDVHKFSVCALGDSPLDLPMLKMADRAIVVVGDEKTRSKSMDSALSDAIDDGLQAHQLLLRVTASPRLDTTKLPVIQSLDSDFIKSLSGISGRGGTEDIPSYRHTIKTANTLPARLLMTPTRDAGIQGHPLRRAHSRIGWYLAVHYLTEILGLQNELIPHVQGHLTNGYILRDEGDTLIVALMRGGEPMALGISEAFPLAAFLHAFCPDDITKYHLTQNFQVLLVDSVINSGKTMIEFVQHIRKINPAIPIVIVAGVVQYKTTSEGAFAKLLASCPRLSLVALRFSETSYVGRGVTDTGNRLFNTTDDLS